MNAGINKALGRNISRTGSHKLIEYCRRECTGHVYCTRHLNLHDSSMFYDPGRPYEFRARVHSSVGKVIVLTR